MSPAGQLVRLVSRFGPPIALMGLIFALSAQPDLGTDRGWIELVGRKLVHMTGYGLLWLLWLRALDWRHPWAAAASAVGYPTTDELHQTVVHGRHGTPVDVALDSVGIAVAAPIRSRGAATLRKVRSTRVRWR